MARMKRQELEKIVKRDLPGYDIVKSEPADAAKTGAEPDEVAPSIDELRRKYLGEEAGAADSAKKKPATKPRPNTDDEIVTVRPQKTGDPFDHAARPKTVVVSGKEKRVIGSQG